jgi:hypothetical protein
MAIGKVGAFATVDPAIADFGAMAENTIDKIQAQRQAKAKAEEDKRKRQLEMLKLQPDMETLDYTGMAVIDDWSRNKMVELKNEFAGLRSINTPESIARQREINNYISNLSSYHKSLKETSTKVFQNESKYNQAYFNDAFSRMNDIDKGDFIIEEDRGYPSLRFFKKDPQTGEKLKDEQGRFMFEENAVSPQSITSIPMAFNINEARQKFSETIKADVERLVDVRKQMSTETQLFDDERLKTAIKGTASQLATNENSLAAWWVSQNPNAPLKKNFTKEDKEKAKEFYEEQLKSTISEKYKESYISMRGGGGSGGAKGLRLGSVVETSIKFNGINETPAKTVALIPGDGRTKGIAFAGDNFVSVNLDEKGNLYAGVVASGGESVSATGKGDQINTGAGTRAAEAKLEYLREDTNKGSAFLDFLASEYGYANRKELKEKLFQQQRFN